MRAMSDLHEAITADGYVLVPAADIRAALPVIDVDILAAFARSWDALEMDEHMADGGRYRRRRHAVFRLDDTCLERQPHQPHFQNVAYNPLNGGIDRWFAPVLPATADSPVLAALIEACRGVFALAGNYRVEMHQFRIEAAPEGVAHPTPEGMHRDGVDRVCVVLIDRVNLDRGVTSICAPDRTPLGAFTLTDPLDTVFLDDHRVMHGVTAIKRHDTTQPGYRDVLILTFSGE